MASRLRVRGFAVGACLLAVTTACTPDQPVTPTSTPSASVATPAETAQEREERLAYAAAEMSYREFRAEVYRVLRNGGARSATARMKATAAGPYLNYFTELVQAYRGQKVHSTGSEKTGFVREQGYSATEVILDVCEDSRGVRDFNSSGSQTGAGEVREVRIKVRKEGSAWKVWDGDGKKVDECA